MIKKLNANLVKVVSILNDGGTYHDGTTIGEKLRMTRSAVWKTIKKLEHYAIKIDSIKGKGYALLEPLILLDKNKIKKNVFNEITNSSSRGRPGLKHAGAGRGDPENGLTRPAKNAGLAMTASVEKIDISIFESIDSTNDYLKSFKQAKEIKICIAEQQTLGRGRLSREWYSPFGKNIYLSCYYSFQKDVSELSGLSLVTSLAIINTLKSYGMNDHLYVKWPNDIIYLNKKLAGGLIEIQAETHGISHAIIGLGLNVNMMNDEHAISQAWTSMQKILGKYIDRNELSARLIMNLLVYLQQFNARGFSPFMNEWVKTDCLTNQWVTVKNINQKIEGKVTGINEQGHLLLRLENGKVRAFSSGDTSIVKRVG